MAIESFRQLILDAQAMMDPDFAGKLSADVRRNRKCDADTGFEFGASAREASPDSASADSATNFDFGGERKPDSLARCHQLSPFAAQPKRPF
jgi:DNA helicase-2/ATP-dependent DNA helicase PcrA